MDNYEEEVGKLRKALRVAIQFVDVAIDWNFEEVEIDGEMRNTYEVREELEEALGGVSEQQA